MRAFVRDPYLLALAAALVLQCGHCVSLYNATLDPLPSFDLVPGLADAALNYTPVWNAGPSHWPHRTNLSVFHVNAIDPEAVCNDGSPAAYYFAPATSLDYANVWLVYLGGCARVRLPLSRPS